MSQNLIQNALRAHKESQASAEGQREATRQRLHETGRGVAVCTAKRVLGLDLDPQSVRVTVIGVSAPGVVSDEAHRLDAVEFLVGTEFGPVEFAVKEGRGFDQWDEDDAHLFVRGPRDTRYSFFRVRDLADFGEYAHAVLLPQTTEETIEKETRDEE